MKYEKTVTQYGVGGVSLKEPLINFVNLPVSPIKMLSYFSEPLQIPPSREGLFGMLNNPMETLTVPQRFCSLQ